MKTNIFLQVVGSIFGTEIELTVQVAGAPLSISLAPKQPLDFLQIWNEVSNAIQEIAGFSLPDLSGGPWGQLLKDISKVQPTLWISPGSGGGGATAAYLELAFERPITVGGEWDIGGGLKVWLAPSLDIYSLYIGYEPGAGFGLRAKVVPIPGPGSSPPTQSAAKVVSYPFPVPAQDSVGVFKVHYLGLGQRVGPTVNVTSDDPLAAIFEQLETQLVGEDPYTILTTLANKFYHPDRNWFIAADLELRGFRVRALFNDPSIYGLEISVPVSPVTPFSGLLFEILYQKLSPNLGVYYGALTLPYALRRIPLYGVILILPGFSIWVYTNGDFRVNIGWPMGNASIGIQVAVLVGAAGLYFAKLRSGDNPGVPTTVNYNPILQFGLGVRLYVHESFNASIFSATIDVTLGGTFQGLLAWKEGESSMSGPPDHYWFAATVSLSVLIQGVVDFSIIKASVLIQFTANAGVAFETGCRTLIAVSASVRVEVRVKIIFFTIGLSFSTSISKTWEIGSGSQVASLNGPVGMTAMPPAQAQVRASALNALNKAIARFAPRQETRAPLTLLAARARAAAASPTTVPLQFMLQPTAVYSASGGPAFNVIASLLMDAPVTNGTPDSPGAATPFRELLTALIQWLLSMFTGTLVEQLRQVVDVLGQGSAAPFGNYDTFATQLNAFLQSGVTFTIGEADLKAASPERQVAVLPIIPALQMEYVDQHGQPQTIDFDSYNPVPGNYATAVNYYFQDIGFSGNAPDASGRAMTEGASYVSPGNPSMATYVWVDYFAMQLRNLASGLLQLAQDTQTSSMQQFLADVERAHGERNTWEVVELIGRQAARLTSDESLQDLLDQFDWVSAAGLGSRFLLNGLQLPEPSQIPPDPTPENMIHVPTAGIYVLTGQQFPIASGSTLASATLKVNPHASVPPDWITFATGSPGQATSEYPLPSEVPAEPAPEWIDGSPGQGVPSSIVITPMPPVSRQPLYVALKNQIAWSDQGQAQTIFPLPPGVLAAAASGAVQISITDAPPPSNNTAQAATGTSYPATPALVIPLSLAQVPLNPQGTLAAPGSPSMSGAMPSGSPAGPVSAQYLPFVYQLNGTDEATRDLIFAALQSDLSNASIRLLYPNKSGSPAAATALRSDDIASDVLIAKTNLSTLNQVPMAGAPFAVMAEKLGAEDVVFAPVSDVASFLRLVWEVSVVNAPGFFLFYVTSDGHGLPTSLFSDLGTEGGMTGELTIVVELAQAPRPSVPIGGFTNSVFISGSVDPAKDVLYAGVSDASGTPVLQYSPTYPAGNIGFVLTWDRAAETPDAPVPVAELYHMLQFQVQAIGGYSESVWSLPAGPAQDNVPTALLEGSPAGAWTYANTIPAYLYKTGSPGGNIYAAMGAPIQIAMRVIDVYGDALPSTHISTQTPRYQDPLVSLGAWQGVQFRFMVTAGTNNTAVLVLAGEFDPASIAPPASPASPGETSSAQQQWLAIAQRYAVIVQQLSDPNTQLTISTTLAGGTLPDSPSIAASLLQFARTILQQVEQAGASSPSTPPQPQSFRASAAVAFSSVVALTGDIIPIGVQVALARTNTNLIDPVALANMPAASSVCYSVPAQLSSGDSPQSPGATSPLFAFAIEFENAFTNFDGAGGMLKLAQRAGVQTGNDPSQIETLWAVRFSATSGISVSFGGSPGGPVYFGLKPMSKTLLSIESGDSATAGADLDLLAQQFVTAYDAFLAPQMAVAIAILDVRNRTSWYDSLTTTKSNLAKTIPLGLANIFTSQQGTGDLSGAQTRLTQALLTELVNAFDVTTVVQVPAAVRVAGQPSPGVSQPPMLYGAVGPIASGSPANASAPADSQKPYTLSAGELDIITGTPWMTSLLTVAQPGKQAALYLPLTYDITYLQHDFTDSDPVGAGAYTASSWLKFLRPGDAPLRIPISEMAGIPIPLIFAPTPPALTSQTAAASPLPSPPPHTIAGEMEAALMWDYRLAITPNWSAQDDLFFDVTYNAPPASTSLAALFDVDPRIGLLTALDDFLTWYRANLSRFPAIVTEAFPSAAELATRRFLAAAAMASASPDDPSQLVATFATKASNVATAWAALYRQTTFATVATEEQIIDSFHLAHDSMSPRTLVLYGTTDTSPGASPRYWPSVTVSNERGSETWIPDPSKAQPAGSPNEGWWVLSHTFGTSSFDALTFTFEKIDLQERQSACASAHIRRNAELVGNEPVNPDFVLETETVSFATSVIPLIHRATLPVVTPDPAGLQQTLIDILTPLANPAAQWASTFRVSGGYAWQLAVPSSRGAALYASDAIMLADGLDFRTTPLETTAGQIAQELAEWYMSTPRSQSGALLTLAVTVFAVVAGERLPLIQLDRIPIDVSSVSDGWWSQRASPALV